MSLLGKLDLKKIGMRLARTDRFLLEVLSMRLAHGGLSDLVAETKRKSQESQNGIFEIKRQEVEDSRIAAMKAWANEIGIDHNFAAALMYLLITESCRTQDELMVKKYKRREEQVNEKDPMILYEYQRKSLLRLTELVADTYDKHYGQDFLGSELYFTYERQVLMNLISGINPKSLAIDVGCATGIVTNELAKYFQKAIGYDISPHMINVANQKIVPERDNLQFIQADVECGIDLPDNSVSLVVINMGTASDFKNLDAVLANIKRILHPQGKFFLSFYNSESLLAKLGFIPWPMPLAAHIDQEINCLEVRAGKEIFFLYARPMNIKEIYQLMSDFKINQVFSFPTCASVLPRAVLANPDSSKGFQIDSGLRDLIYAIDLNLSNSPLLSGTYIIVTGGKK